MEEVLRFAVFLGLVSWPGTTFGASFVNFESGHVRPLALSPSRELLFVVNTPDNRLEIFRATEAGLERAGEVMVGLEPVAVWARTDREVLVVNHLSDSVSVVDATDVSRPFVKATLLVGDEPRDVVVGGTSRDRIFITTAHRGQNNPLDPQLTTPGVGRADVWVFDANDLSSAPHVLTLFCDTPRALAVSPDGTRVYAAAFHSGNQTTCLAAPAVTENSQEELIQGDATIDDGFTAPGLPPPLENVEGVPAPETGLIVKYDGEAWRDDVGRDWTPRLRFNLPDKDVFVIDASQDPPIEIGCVTDVGTVLFNMAVNPATGKVYVSNTDARNHVRFEPRLRGYIADTRITIIDGTEATPVLLNPHIDYSRPAGPPEEIASSLAFPFGMEFTADGETLYVAAFGSGKVGVLSSDAKVQRRIEVGGGPSGLALDEGRGRLYVMNRFDQTISMVDTAAQEEVGVVPLAYNPEPASIREGRPLLYDAVNSGHGDAACASCHVFADFDSLAWDLGDPGGSVADNPVQSRSGNTNFLDFHPMKGPMTTQSLRGLKSAGPMHWRGDRNAITSGASRNRADVFDEGLAFMAFRPAFETLLGKETELPPSEMEKFRDFILTVKYPPNPIARIDGTLREDEAGGREIFTTTRAGGKGNVSCADCHALPLGTAGRGSGSFQTQDFKVPHLRNLYQRVGMFGYAFPDKVSEPPLVLEPTPTPHRGDQVRGFGYLHDGSVPNLLNFFLFPSGVDTFRNEPGRSTQQKAREIAAFLLAFDTGLSPVVGHQITLDRETLETSLSRLTMLRERADAGDCDLVARGIVRGEARGFVYAGGGNYQSDREAELLSESELLEAVEGGVVLTATAVYRGGGHRIGIDRDQDGLFDRDEIDAGSDPSAITRSDVSPWTAEDVGGPAIPGVARAEGECSLVRAGGRDIGAASDEFHFLYQEFRGDVSITARVADLVPPDSTSRSKAGLMLRASLDPASAHATIVLLQHPVTPGVWFLDREATGERTTLRRSNPRRNDPWLRLERRGNDFVGWRSEDAETWSEVRRVTLDLPEAILGGVAVTAGDIEEDFSTVVATVCDLEVGTPRLEFLRGDCNGDATVNVADAACALNYMFGGVTEPPCLASLNTNGDGDANIVDPIALLNFLFGGGPPPAAPFPECGPGILPADEELGCENPPAC